MHCGRQSVRTALKVLRGFGPGHWLLSPSAAKRSVRLRTQSKKIRSRVRGIFRLPMTMHVRYRTSRAIAASGSEPGLPSSKRPPRLSSLANPPDGCRPQIRRLWSTDCNSLGVSCTRSSVAPRTRAAAGRALHERNSCQNLYFNSNPYSRVSFFGSSPRTPKPMGTISESSMLQ